MLYFRSTNKGKLWNPLFNTIISAKAESNETEVKEVFFSSFVTIKIIVVFLRNVGFFPLASE